MTEPLRQRERSTGEEISVSSGRAPCDPKNPQGRQSRLCVRVYSPSPEEVPGEPGGCTVPWNFGKRLGASLGFSFSVSSRNLRESRAGSCWDSRCRLSAGDSAARTDLPQLPCAAGSRGPSPGPTGFVLAASQPCLRADPLHPGPKAAGEVPPSVGGEQEALPQALPLRRLGRAGRRQRSTQRAALQLRQLPLGAAVLSPGHRLLFQARFPFILPELLQRFQEVLERGGEGRSDRHGEPRSCLLRPGPGTCRDRSSALCWPPTGCKPAQGRRSNREAPQQKAGNCILSYPSSAPCPCFAHGHLSLYPRSLPGGSSAACCQIPAGAAVPHSGPGFDKRTGYSWPHE